MTIGIARTAGQIRGMNPAYLCRVNKIKACDSLPEALIFEL